ncbi:hypothetical protein AURDEDRAFT_165677 [Auricularia subglabra TFB-10046 SS5]|nr:hypothetical protein AURDEDRAFT_165677 [Auricularia subglabra TFB-10046 SS5]
MKHSVDISSIIPLRLLHLEEEPEPVRLVLLHNVLCAVRTQDHIKDSDDVLATLEALAAGAGDPNMQCALLACDTLLALTTRIENNRFARYRAAVVPALLRAFSSQHEELTLRLSDVLDAIFAISTISALTESVIKELKPAAPRISTSALEFIQRCLKKTPFTPVLVFARMLACAIVQIIRLAVDEVLYGCALRTMGTLVRVVGPTAVLDMLSLLKDAEYAVVVNSAHHVQVAYPSREPIQARLGHSRAENVTPMDTPQVEVVGETAR